MGCPPRGRDLTRRGRRAVLVGAAALYAVVVAMAPLVWHHQGPGPSNGIDEWSRVVLGTDLTRALNDLHVGQAAEQLFPILGALGDPREVMVMIVLLGLLCLLSRDWLGLSLSAVGPLSAVLLTEYALKPLVHRIRDGAFQYPSGHCTGSAAVSTLAVVLLYRHGGRRAVLWGGWIFVLPPVLVFVSVQRLHLHDLMDSVAGLAVGVATVLVVAATLTWVADLAHGFGRTEGEDLGVVVRR